MCMGKIEMNMLKIVQEGIFRKKNILCHSRAVIFVKNFKLYIEKKYLIKKMNRSNADHGVKSIFRKFLNVVKSLTLF